MKRKTVFIGVVVSMLLVMATAVATIVVEVLCTITKSCPWPKPR